MVTNQSRRAGPGGLGGLGGLSGLGRIGSGGTSRFSMMLTLAECAFETKIV